MTDRPEDKGSLFLIRETDGSITVTVRAPGTANEASITVDAETWKRMRDPGQPHFLTKWEREQYERGTLEQHFPRAGASRAGDF